MINKSIMSKIDNLINHKYWTNYLGLARTLLSFATLLTLLSNSQNTLFRFGIKDENNITANGLVIDPYGICVSIPKSKV